MHKMQTLQVTLLQYWYSARLHMATSEMKRIQRTNLLDHHPCKFSVRLLEDVQ